MLPSPFEKAKHSYILRNLQVAGFVGYASGAIGGELKNMFLVEAVTGSIRLQLCSLAVLSIIKLFLLPGAFMEFSTLKQTGNKKADFIALYSHCASPVAVSHCLYKQPCVSNYLGTDGSFGIYCSNF
jgi:hypothetical protein